MKTLRTLILVDAALLTAFGFGIALFHPHAFPVVPVATKPYQEMATLRFLGAALGGLALVVLASGTLSLAGDYRRLACWLSAANGIIAVTAFTQQTAIWESTLGWVLVLVPLGLTVGLAWLGLRPLRPEEATAELSMLQISPELRAAMLRQIGEAAAQEERNRLARDLHDSIKQQLFTINVSTAAAQERWDRDPEGARTALADVRRSAKEAMVEMQALLHQLRPGTLTSTGLVEALREQCEALGYRTGAQVTLELGEPLSDDRLSPGTLEALFRSAQEALGNVARHARARKVRVWIGRDGWSARLHVEDDGQGFDPETANAGMGLRNLRERAESLSGRLHVVSAPGSGTRIGVYIPLLAPPAERIEYAISAVTREINWGISFTCILFWQTVTDETPFFRAAFYAALLLVSAFLSKVRERSTLQENPRATPDVSRLRHAEHQSRAFHLLTVGCWAFCARSLPATSGDAWQAALDATAILCAALTGFELIRLRHLSRLRRAWPKRSQWRLGKYWSIISLVVLLICMLTLEHKPLGSGQLLWICLMGALFVYLFTRQPGMAGVDP
ncbi:MAG TPA: sensor histidine kinase [Thermoanaerobaculia bacterium]|jgi:signal transduction histidine kinase|nr:sensor histidine kinase [Thermoanaerobaculia bacterium]